MTKECVHEMPLPAKLALWLTVYYITKDQQYYKMGYIEWINRPTTEKLSKAYFRASSLTLSPLTVLIYAIPAGPLDIRLSAAYYRSPVQRLASYRNWPLSHPLSAIVLAQDGLVHAVDTECDLDSDLVICPFCFFHFRIQLNGSSVFEAHRQVSPPCSFLASIREEGTYSDVFQSNSRAQENHARLARFERSQRNRTVIVRLQNSLSQIDRPIRQSQFSIWEMRSLSRDALQEYVRHLFQMTSIYFSNLVTRSAQQTSVMTRSTQHTSVMTRSRQHTSVMTRSAQHTSVMTRSAQHTSVMTRSRQHTSVMTRSRKHTSVMTRSRQLTSVMTRSRQHTSVMTRSRQHTSVMTRSAQHTSVMTRSAQHTSVMTRSAQHTSVMTRSRQHTSVMTRSRQLTSVMTRSRQHTSVMTRSRQHTSVMTRSRQHTSVMTRSTQHTSVMTRSTQHTSVMTRSTQHTSVMTRSRQHTSVMTRSRQHTSVMTRSIVYTPDEP
ncbi:uncharacterized protein LOC129925753 [Biomphalaria glabrata]|uniref:Uncharacterized protein LOC129925753 n=1 Tax=Biomphalaria glabrata TaxID=6526 RepID=A0A9W3A4P9_BIOGL|nr:uncharacterized protein LOC129925753 [Biomphalaria glabrata]